MVLVFETLRWTLYLKGPQRANHAAVAVGLDVYSFGGSIGLVATYMNRDQIEVHIFNTVSLRWIKLTPMTTGRGEHPHAVPSMRMGHTAVLIADIIYVWGGFKYTRDFCNVLYAFDVNTHRWFKPKISGNVPETKYNHSACALVKVMYIFGGFNLLTGCTNDIHKLDTTTMVWSLINAAGIPAPGSLYHTANIIGKKMYVFGGHGDQFIYSNNVYVFDTETDCWLRTPSTQLLPEKRRGHSAFAYNGELYIFGGDNYPLNRTLDDLWKFNPETFSWKKIEPKGKGPCSSSFRMCCCMVGDRIVLFGGYIPDDLYILDLSPGLKTLCKLAVIQYGLEQSGLPHDIRWELKAMTTNSNRTLC